ncbi:hypothetical protein [Homoserinibacter sp. GY 40078]|uniref:hypothetical protein n=1 Tax=Homoserinibacter sp. GY 40078 TaxID=2603275 RepID=UPI0011C70B7B|nr:hypothetical protein [Homoserinibacter sp. GY 40078]TXK17421.1 hypothetical protein FVQ89_11350 [Homoserinibacter sp. GY 40078]
MQAAIIALYVLAFALPFVALLRVVFVNRKSAPAPPSPEFTDDFEADMHAIAHQIGDSIRYDAKVEFGLVGSGVALASIAGILSVIAL